jgi:hypothetical protein
MNKNDQGNKLIPANWDCSAVIVDADELDCTKTGR